MQELTIKNIPLKVLEKMNLPLTSEMFNEIANFNDNLKPDFGYPTLKDTPDIKFNEISEDVPEYVKNFLLNKITQKLEEGIVTIESEDEEKISIELFTDASSFILNPVELLEDESLIDSDIDLMSEIQFILKETDDTVSPRAVVLSTIESQVSVASGTVQTDPITHLIGQSEALRTSPIFAGDNLLKEIERQERNTVLNIQGNIIQEQIEEFSSIEYKSKKDVLSLEDLIEEKIFNQQPIAVAENFITVTPANIINILQSYNLFSLKGV
jgi:hypothetical protein